LTICGIFFAVILVFEEYLEQHLGVSFVWGAYAIPYLACGTSIIRAAGRALARGDIFNEFTLMALATLAAIAMGELPEAVGVMLFYRCGEFFQGRAASNSRRSIGRLLASKPDLAHVQENRQTIDHLVEDVLPGQQITVQAGEKIPLDGVVLAGVSTVDQSPLTGESAPIGVQAGDRVLGGSINLGSVLTVEVQRPFDQSQIARILELVEHASANKSSTERFITRFARYYTPTITAAALLVAALPPLFLGGDWRTWAYRALILLVIACPCALLISIPLGYFGGIGAASRRGILVKGGIVFDNLLHVDNIVFRIEADASQTAGVLAEHGIRSHMLTDDMEDTAAWAAEQPNLAGGRPPLLPEEKAAALPGFAQAAHTAYVGDDINDAPLLALSRVGIAMGGMGAKTAIEAADVVILNDSPEKIPELFAIARRVRRVVWQNIALAFGVKGLIMIFGIAGLSGLWEAVFADVGVALLAVLNAVRGTRK